MIKKKPSIEFSIWERKLLLSIVDFFLVFSALLIYNKVDSPDKSIVGILSSDYTNIVYGVFVFWMYSSILNLYNLEYANQTRKILPLVFTIGFLFTITFVFTPKITPFLPTQRIIILGFVLGFTFALALWRMIYAHYIHAPAFFKNVIVLVSNDFDKDFVSNMKDVIEGNNDHHGYKVARTYPLAVNGRLDKKTEKVVDKIVSKKLVDTIVILGRDHEKISTGINKSLIKAIQSGIEVQTYLKLYEELQEAIPLNLAGRQFYTIFPISRHNSNYFYQFWNRSLDVFSSIFGLFFMLLLIPFIFIANIFVNRGPLFYTQKRVGKGGLEYDVVKFRSMVISAEDTGAKMSVKGDSRITKLGKFLRKTRIDELPQFWAVLKGDMSLIGPRPERKVFVDKLSESIHFYNARHIIRPGITGWAQVKYPYGEDLKDSYYKLEYDLYYIKNRSITMDIRVVIKTINTIIFSKGQ